jgi:hypothetical protein
VAVGCSVDLFLFNNAYIDIATLSQVLYCWCPRSGLAMDSHYFGKLNPDPELGSGSAPELKLDPDPR